MLRVLKQENKLSDGRTTMNTYLMHGTTHHGLNYQEPEELRRLATTYYHRNGPVGVIMEKMNWFGHTVDPKTGKLDNSKTFNKYDGDNRMPTSFVGAGRGRGGPGQSHPDPADHRDLEHSVGAALRDHRPGHRHPRLLRPARSSTSPSTTSMRRSATTRSRSTRTSRAGRYFNYVQDAIRRGVKVEIVMGDVRLSMNEEARQENSTYFYNKDFQIGMKNHYDPDKWGEYQTTTTNPSASTTTGRSCWTPSVRTPSPCTC